MKTYYVTFTYQAERFAVSCEDLIDASMVKNHATGCFKDIVVKTRKRADEKLMSIEEFDAITDEIIYSK